MNKTRKRKIVALALLLSAICIVTPLSIWASNAEPTIGSATNVADSAIVNNAGVNVTESYREDKKVTFNEAERGSFGELVFGSTNTYTYSADVTFREDSSTYGSIRFVLGTGIRTKDSKACTIEVGIRPNCGDAVLFANANGDEGEPLGHIANIEGLEIGDTYRYTAKYEDGKISFWVNDGKLIFDEIDITGTVKDIALTTAYYSQNCKGTIADVKIWGDVKPLIDGTADNVADVMTVKNHGVDITSSYQTDKMIPISVAENSDKGFGEIGNLIFGSTNRYIVTADVNYTSDSTTWGSIRLSVGKGYDSKGNEQTIGVCVRPNTNQILIGSYLSADPWEIYPYAAGMEGLKIPQSYRYTALYDNGKITFWVDGVLVADSVDVTEILTNIKPALGFNTQNCTGSISNMIIQGDVEGITLPKFDADKNENILTKSVILDSTGIPSAFTSDMGMTYTKTGEEGFVRYSFAGLQYGKSYCFSTKAKFSDNTSHTDWSHEGLRIQVATAKKDDKEYRIEVNIRQGVTLLFACYGTGSDYCEVGFAELWNQNNAFNEEQTYSIRYRENGNFDFFQNGKGLYTNYDLTEQGYTNIKPCVGIGGEVCAFSYSNMKLWGDVTVDTTKVPELPEEPEFDADKDTNLMKQVSVKHAVTGKQSVLTDCTISSGEGVTGNTMMTVYGTVFGKSYHFSSNVAFYDNPNVDYEGVVVKVATAKKDGKTYDVEIHFRKDYALFKVGDTEITDEVVYNTGTVYNAVSRYTVSYRSDNTISAFVDGKSVFFKFDLTQKGYTNIRPAFGFGGEVCSYSYSGMKLWGDVEYDETLVPEVPEEPVFDADSDINLMKTAVVTNPSNGKTGVLTNCELVTAKDYTDSSKATITALQYGKSYQFSTKAAFGDNKTQNSDYGEVNWEGLVFEVATVEKDGNTYAVEVRFRNTLVGIFVNNEPYALDSGRQTAYDSENQYTVAYHDDGTFSVFQNGNSIYWKYDITEEGYTNVKPSFAFGGEACSYSYKEMKLWGDIYLKEMPSVPQKPASNGNYADYMRVPQSSMIKYEDGKIYSTTDEITGRAEFQYLPFDTDDTYVFGFNINTKKADAIWMGPRIPFGETKDGKELVLYIMEEGIGVFHGEESLKTVPFARELNQVYRVDMLIKPESVSVWVDNVLLIEDVKLPKKAEVKNGILFENAIAVMSHIDLYYTEKVKFVVPEIPEAPILKNLKDGQYNAADWMSVTLNNKKYGGYFENKLSSTDSSEGNKYLFENLPVTDSMSYYYSATYTVTESSAVWKGPRFIFRQDGSTAFYVAVLQDSIIVLAGSEQVASSPLKLQLGKEYDIVMYSTPTDISVWIDGTLIFESVDLTSYINKKLSAKPGILFELCQAKVTNLAIYGDKIVFDEKYVDEELYYSKYYKMRGIPQMTGVNLFENVFMTDLSNGAIGAEYDSENRVLTTAYPEGSGVVKFRDANGSANLNGLKNKTGYVLSFQYRVDDWQAETAGESGFWFTTNSSAGPWTTETNEISFGFSGDAVMLAVDKEGVEITKQDVGRSRANGKTYDVAIVHGKNWIKLYVDNELQMVSTQLPTYNTEFQIWFSNVKAELSNFKLYEFEDSGLEILQTVTGSEKTKAGNTIYDAEEHVFSSRIKAPVLVCMIAGEVVLICVVVITVVLLKERKRRRENRQMGGNVSCEEKE